LKVYDNSLSKALAALYPNFEWKPWKFRWSPKGFWQNKNNVKSFLESLKKDLNLQKQRDWFFISNKQIKANKGRSLLTKGLFNTLMSQYPEHNWSIPTRIAPSKGQLHLHRIIKSLFPSEQVLMDFRHAGMLFSRSQHKMQLDIFIPTLQLAFEYQGGQHYTQHYLFGNPFQLHIRDKEKQAACERLGITLITIPYWWNGATDSLLATIHKIRPDLVPKSSIKCDSHSKFS